MSLSVSQRHWLRECKHSVEHDPSTWYCMQNVIISSSSPQKSNTWLSLLRCWYNQERSLGVPSLALWSHLPHRIHDPRWWDTDSGYFSVPLQDRFSLKWMMVLMDRTSNRQNSWSFCSPSSPRPCQEAALLSSLSHVLLQSSFNNHVLL